MIKYIFLLFFIILLLSGCGDKLSTSSTDDSANITKSLLTGTWTAKCSDNTTASTSSKTVLVFSDSGDNLTATTTNYSDLSCVTQSIVFTKDIYIKRSVPLLKIIKNISKLTQKVKS